MAENVSIDLQDNSPYRVAYDLALLIAKQESGTKDRAYLLNLYAQCRKVVIRGNSAEEAIGRQGV